MSKQKQPSYRITFEPGNRTTTASAGETLLTAARRLGLHVNASCGGDGVCGQCRVIVEQGAVSSPASEKIVNDHGAPHLAAAGPAHGPEHASPSQQPQPAPPRDRLLQVDPGDRLQKISPEERRAGHCLACTTVISGDTVVRIPVESGLGKGGLTTGDRGEVAGRNRARMHVYDIEELRQHGLFLPPVAKFFLELPRAGHADNMADAGRVINGLNSQYNEHRMVITLPVLQKLPAALRRDDFRVTVTVARPVHDGKNFIMDIQSGNWTRRNFGLAFDLGTTSIYGILVDLETGRVLARHGAYNAQLSYGEDVISRIIHAEKPRGLELMQELAVTTFNQVLDRLLAVAHPPQEAARGAVRREEISSITVAANPTMTHLLLGLDPSHIRRAPYVPVSTFLPPVRAADLGLRLDQHAVALCYPSVSSYVGGDIVAGVMGSGMYRTEKLTLYLDIGTNAEIVIGNREWLVCAACSAGPAFEGGGITHGMRAAQGAIDDFTINPETLEPQLGTVENKPPVGICGSGLLNLVAALFTHGVLDHRGRFQRNRPTPRLREGRSGWEYVLAWRRDTGVEHDIVINEVDIENFIRAKAAIFAGVKTLVEEVGLQVGDLEQVILAGAFGSYLDLDAAMAVGLLPEIAPEKFLYVGNGSLMGAWMSAVSHHIRRDVVAVVRKLTSFELSEVNAFQEQYTASQFLPHTDLNLFPAVKRRLAG